MNELRIESDTEIKPGIHSLGTPHWDADAKEWRVLANCLGALAIVVVNVYMIQDGQRFKLIPTPPSSPRSQP